MIIYYIMLLNVFLLLFISRKCQSEYNRKIKSNFFIVCALLIICLIAGLRWNVGTDFPMYNSFFEQYKHVLTFNMRIEPMFKLFCFIPGQIFDTSTMTFFLIAVYTYLLVFIFCKKNCKYYDLAIFLFIGMGFYFSSLNIVRQWMAIPNMLLVYYFLSKEKYGKALIFFILSYLCHYTSILLLPILFILKVIHTEKARIFLIIFFILLYQASDIIVPIIQGFFANVSFLEKYTYYFNKPNTMDAKMIWPAICLLVYLYYIFFLKRSTNIKKNYYLKKISLYINVLIFAFAFSLFGTQIDIFERISHYFLPIIIVIIPMVLEVIQNEEWKKVIILFVVILGIAFYTNTMINNGGEILPYTIIFEGE